MAQTAEDKLNKAFRVTSIRTDKFVTTSMHPDCKLRSEKRCGNTTRQANFIIESLFNGNAVLCLDHHEYGENIPANKRLMDIVLGRLKTEHPGLVHPNYIEYNHLYSYIFLKEPRA